jgi:hypothetical protein
VSSPETEQISSIRAIRPVIPSDSLRHFLKSAGKLITDGGFELVDRPDAEVLIFAASALHSTLYVRRAPVTRDNNDRLRKIVNHIELPHHYEERRVRKWPGGSSERRRYKRDNPFYGSLQLIQDNYIPEDDQPLFRADKIVDCTTEDPARRGFELALLVTPGPTADVLEGQSGALKDEVSKRNANKLLPSEDHEVNPLEIPFMRAPFISGAVRDEYIQALSSELPVHGMGLRAVEYKHGLVDV